MNIANLPASETGTRPFPKPPASATSPARVRLRAAHEARHAAQAALRHASERANRARQMFDTATRDHAALGDVEGAVAAHAAQQYRSTIARAVLAPKTAFRRSLFVLQI